jgi:mannose-6-phosphate isomerase-like protein (cupin superfamily)
MKRRNFIGASIFPSLALDKIQSFLGLKRADKVIKVEAGKDRFDKPITLMEGDTFFTKVATADTNGDLFVFESIRDMKGGVPLHYHFEQDEWWYVLEGEFLFKIGEETFTARKGDSVFGPRMVPHTFSKISDGPARLLMAFQPAGRMEAHFKALSEGIYAKLTEAEKKEFRKKNGFEVVGPALDYDKTKH